ncbi:MAG: hypothetical protein ABW172_15460, partial [Candidatus Binatia bacterium]
EAELANKKQTADQERAQITELEQRASNLDSELKKADGQRIELREKLNQANAEVERLKTELEQHKTVPPVSVSPPP